MLSIQANSDTRPTNGPWTGDRNYSTCAATDLKLTILPELIVMVGEKFAALNTKGFCGPISPPMIGSTSNSHAAVVEISRTTSFSAVPIPLSWNLWSAPLRQIKRKLSLLLCGYGISGVPLPGFSCPPLSRANVPISLNIPLPYLAEVLDWMKCDRRSTI